MCDALPVSLLGMNAAQMVQFIKFSADRVLAMLDVAPLYNESNPFDFMHLLRCAEKQTFSRNVWESTNGQPLPSATLRWTIRFDFTVLQPWGGEALAACTPT